MIRLYLSASCGFCHMVLRAAHQLGLREGQEFEIIDAARGTPGREELIKLGGRHQVPFMTDDDGDVAMYESYDIIDYLQNKSNS